MPGCFLFCACAQNPCLTQLIPCTSVYTPNPRVSQLLRLRAGFLKRRLKFIYVCAEKPKTKRPPSYPCPLFVPSFSFSFSRMHIFMRNSRVSELGDMDMDIYIYIFCILNSPLGSNRQSCSLCFSPVWAYPYSQQWLFSQPAHQFRTSKPPIFHSWKNDIKKDASVQNRAALSISNWIGVKPPFCRLNPSLNTLRLERREKKKEKKIGSE